MSAVAGTSAPNFFGKTCGRWGLTKPTPSQKGVPLALRCAEALRRKPSPTLSVSSSGKVALGYLLRSIFMSTWVFFPAVFRPFRTVFPGLGAGFLNLGGKMGRTAKKREKTGKNGREMA